MLVRTDEDDPQYYDDEERSDLPWCHRPSASFGETHETIEAVQNLKEGFQAKGQQIRVNVGVGASDAAVAAALRGEVEQSLRGISCTIHKPAIGTRHTNKHPYRQDQGSSIANQHHLLVKFGEYNIPIASGTLHRHVAEKFFGWIKTADA